MSLRAAQRGQAIIRKNIFRHLLPLDKSRCLQQFHIRQRLLLLVVFPRKKKLQWLNVDTKGWATGSVFTSTLQFWSSLQSATCQLHLWPAVRGGEPTVMSPKRGVNAIELWPTWTHTHTCGGCIVCSCSEDLGARRLALPWSESTLPSAAKACKS